MPYPGPGRQAPGWPRDLRDLRVLSGKASAEATAFGLRTLLLLEDGLAADLVEVTESLRKMALPGGGYAGIEQSAARPEATAAVLNALRRTAAAEDFGVHIAQMEKDLGDFEKCRPFILTTMLETSLLLKSETKLTETLIDSLLAARRPYGDHLLWPEKAEPLLIDPDPSVAHTARAVRVLANVQSIRPSSQVQESLDQAVAWLTEQSDLRNAYEVIERPVDGALRAGPRPPLHGRLGGEGAGVGGPAGRAPLGEQRGCADLEQLRWRYRGPVGVGQRRSADLDDLRRGRRTAARQSGRPGSLQLVRRREKGKTVTENAHLGRNAGIAGAGELHFLAREPGRARLQFVVSF